MNYKHLNPANSFSITNSFSVSIAGGKPPPARGRAHKAHIVPPCHNSRGGKKKGQGFLFVKGQSFPRTRLANRRFAPCDMRDAHPNSPSGGRTPVAAGAAGADRACPGSCSSNAPAPAHPHRVFSNMRFTGEARSGAFHTLFTICQHLPPAVRDEVVWNTVKQAPRHLFEAQVSRDCITSSNINLYLPTNQH